ncbi:hypothetical protein SSX86_009978 [Deinandra increscens subsp. villosa]|uniref:non-specific serine/threonine protein kinase n=1 Tax=Deinandra increscens subsp. villosa TaxID=3103831 RepID=A0AAP0DI00_9ASTR
MAPAPNSAPAPETPSPSSDSSPPPSDSSPPPPPPDSSPPPPASPSPPPPNSQPPSSPDDDSGGYSPPPPNLQPPPAPPNVLPPPSQPAASSPPPPANIPSRETPPSPILSPPNVLPNRGDASDEAAPGPARKLPSPSSRKSASKSSADSDSISNSSATNIPIIIGGIAAAIFVFLALVIICVICKKKKRKPYYIPEQGPGVGGGVPYYHGKPDHVVKVGSAGGGGGGGGGWGQPPQPPPMSNVNDFPGPRMSVASTNMPLALSQSQFSYDELSAATGGFTQYNLLGQGGFGFVHKGVLPNGQEVAVKSLKSGSGQGEREFQAEVEIISRVHHRYLVSLVGYCISGGQRMLVYEYVPNNTLEFHLHGKGPAVLDWQTRMRIALGSAKGLAYLHEDCHPRIIHRDIKSANILLDHAYEAKVADFGLAKLTSGNDTHVSTRVMGTFGYLAPEYASSGKLSEKSDTFSFGVMLLEILTGRKPIDPESEYTDESLVEWARPLIAKANEDGDYKELVDPRLKDSYDRNEMAQMASCAAASVRHSARRRPKMSQIVRALEGNASLDSLDEKETKDTNESRVYDTQAYNDDMLKFRKMVMSSEESSGSEIGSSGQYR